MQLFGTSVIEHREKNVRIRSIQTLRGQAGTRLRAVAAVMLTLAAGIAFRGLHSKPPEREQRLPKRPPPSFPALLAVALTELLRLRSFAT